MQPVRVTKTKKDKKNTPSSGKLGFRPDQPRLRIKIQSCMVDDLQMIVLNFKFDQNRLSSYRDVRGYIVQWLIQPCLYYRTG